ncbi:hypothetical protein KSP40_PGU004276 [Platanthera guangdongensis]|uniref:Rad60/SUMO-like domain-containing protein n=1 Tax=Platanthera guangdongensis TaxID=2320717 RepID=A0ABR2LGY0_9ASPA
MDQSSEEEFAPLFDYSGVQLPGFHYLSDDDSDFSPLVSKSNRKRKNSCVKLWNGKEIVNVLDEQEKDGKGDIKKDEEEDWLPPPPKIPKIAPAVVQDKTLLALRFCFLNSFLELRSTKLELASLAEAARDLLNSASEFGNDDDVLILENSAAGVKGVKCLEKVERERILISVQDKDGHKQFRLFADDKFERLFKIYAQKANLKLESLAFSFDGERVSPTATPAGLGLENDDIIEVHVKA